MVTKTIRNLFGLSVVSYRFTELPERESRLLQLRECQKATVRWQEYLGSVHRISMNWNGKNLLMDVPSSAMGDRILYTGDEVCFHINEKNAVKIGDER